jgi:AcrR family transcriptional regulator
MTKGALYYYFRDKEDILYACHDYSLSLVLENLAQVEASEASNEEKLRELIKAHVNVMLDALQGSAMALDFNALSAPLLENIVSKRDAFERGMRKLIADGMAEGTFAKGDEKLAAFMILGAINWVTKWYREGGRFDGDVIGETYADTFINGLKGAGVTTGKASKAGKKPDSKSKAKPATSAASKAKPKAKKTGR